MCNFVDSAEKADLLCVALRLLRRAQRNAYRGEQSRAVIVDRIKGAAANQRFDDAPVHDAFIHALAKVEQILERPTLLARGDYRRNSGFASSLDGTQTITDRLRVERQKPVFAAIDIRRQYLEPVGAGVLIKQFDLVGVVSGCRQVGGHERGSMMRFEIRGVISDERISGGV